MDTKITPYRIPSMYSSWTVDSPSIKLYETFDTTKCYVYMTLMFVSQQCDDEVLEEIDTPTTGQSIII